MNFETKKVWVTGHKNPDTDSICAAISYAYLKNQNLIIYRADLKMWIWKKTSMEMPSADRFQKEKVLPESGFRQLKASV